MIIQWLGRSCFKVQTKNGSDESTIVIDPFEDNTSGLKMPRIQADILLMTHNHHDHNNAAAIKGEPFTIVNPGEYEFHGVFVYGIPAFHDDKQGQERGLTNVYKIITEEISIVHLGDLGQTLSDEQLERLGNVDILMIPVGGKYTINSEKANEVISQLEPRFVIPMHYKMDGEKASPDEALDTLDKFLKSSGLPSEKMEKFKISKKDLVSQAETKIITLSI